MFSFKLMTVTKTGFTHESPSAETTSWYTPAYIFNLLGLTFDLDVCAPQGGVPWIPAKNHYALLMYDGDLIQPEQIVITEDEIKVKSGTITYEVFIADPLYDSGLYKSTKEFNTEVKERFKLVKILKY